MLRGFFSLRLHLADVVRDWGVLAALATLFAQFGRWHWIPDLASHFAPHYSLILLPATAWMLAQRRFRIATVLAAALAVNLYALSAAAPRALNAPADAPRIRVACMNVLRDNKDSERVVEVLRAANVDVVLAMEVTESWMERLAPLRAHLPYVVELPQDDCFGIALFSRIPLDDARIEWTASGLTPAIFARLVLGGRAIRLLGLHPVPPVSAMQWSWRNDQLADAARIAATTREPLLVFGDFNATPWNVHLRAWTRGSGLQMPPALWHPSWPSFAPRVFRIPIDLVLASDHWRFTEYRTLEGIGSDHLPVLAELALVE
ncbi:MAG TPA: endonuclease/exonuclease/phosphatase family protein [Kiritimatiellia bacterium]|nr:endonuclease/exonuclease/phosphatase family protein [Kiritimatiellia bacterium]